MVLRPLNLPALQVPPNMAASVLLEHAADPVAVQFKTTPELPIAARAKPTLPSRAHGPSMISSLPFSRLILCSVSACNQSLSLSATDLGTRDTR